MGTQTLTQINALSGGGCQVVDKQFSGFTASGGATQGTDPNNPGLSNIQMTGSTPAPGFIPGSAFDVSVIFGTTGHNWDSTIFPNTSTSSFDYLLSIDPTFLPANNYVFSGVGLSLGTVTGLIGVSDGVTVTKNMCLGATNVPANGGPLGACNRLATVQIVATGVAGGAPTFQDFCTLTGVVGNLCAGTSSSASFLFPAAAQIFKIASIQDSVQIFNGNPNNSLAVTLSSLTNRFSESGTAIPEPSSLILFGTALGAFGLLKYRRRKG